MRRAHQSDAESLADERKTKTQRVSLVDDIESTFQTVYNVFARKLARSSPMYGDLFIYPPLIFESMAKHMSSVLTEIDVAVKQTLRKSFDEQQHKNHSLRVQALLNNHKETEATLYSLNVASLALVFIFTGVSIHPDVTVNETILRLLSWSPINEPNEQISAFLTSNPSLVQLIQQRIADLNLQWNSFWHSLTFYRSKQELMNTAGTDNIFGEMAKIKWRDIDEHPWVTSRTAFDQSRAKELYPLFNRQALDMLMASGLAVHLPEDQVDGNTALGIVKRHFTTHSFDMILEVTSKRLLEKTISALEQEASAVKECARCIDSTCSALAAHYDACATAFISNVFGNPVVSRARQQLNTLSEHIMKLDAAEWKLIKQNPAQFVPASMPTEVKALPDIQCAMPEIVITAIRLMRHPSTTKGAEQACSNALLLDAKDGVMRRLDDLYVLPYTAGTDFLSFASRATQLDASADAFKAEETKAEQQLMKQLMEVLQTDLLTERTHWMIERIKECASPDDFKLAMQAGSEDSLQKLLPRTTKVINQIRVATREVIHALCGCSSKFTPHLEEARIRLQAAFFTSDVWLPSADKRIIALSDWRRYHNKLIELSTKMADIQSQLQAMLALVNVDVVMMPADPSISSITIAPGSIRMLRMRSEDNYQRLNIRQRAPKPTWLQTTVFANKCGGGGGKDPFRRLLAALLFQSIRDDSNDLPIYTTIIDEKQPQGLQDIVSSIDEMLRIETLYALEDDINYIEKVAIGVSSASHGTHSPSAPARQDDERRRWSPFQESAVAAAAAVDINRRDDDGPQLSAARQQQQQRPHDDDAGARGQQGAIRRAVSLSERSEADQGSTGSKWPVEIQRGRGRGGPQVPGSRSPEVAGREPAGTRWGGAGRSSSSEGEDDRDADGDLFEFGCGEGLTFEPRRPEAGARTQSANGLRRHRVRL